MVLESERRECMAKKRPARPRPARVGEPLLGPGAGISAPGLAVYRVDLQIESTAMTRPTVFHPPFGECIMGQIGLFVQKANLAILEASKPKLKAEMRASRRCG
jgi:hypothetical protein